MVDEDRTKKMCPLTIVGQDKDSVLRVQCKAMCQFWDEDEGECLIRTALLNYAIKSAYEIEIMEAALATKSENEANNKEPEKAHPDILIDPANLEEIKIVEKPTVVVSTIEKQA